MSLISSRSALTQPLEVPLVGGVSGITTGPGLVGGARWMWDAVAGAMFETDSQKHTSPVPRLKVKDAVPVPSGSPGPGLSAAPVIVTDNGAPPAATTLRESSASTSIRTWKPLSLFMFRILSLLVRDTGGNSRPAISFALRERVT